MAFHNDSFQVWKKSLPSKILSSFALTAQPCQNIANRSNKQIHDTDKRLFSILLAFYGHVISNMAYMPRIFHPRINYFVMFFTVVENG